MKRSIVSYLGMAMMVNPAWSAPHSGVNTEKIDQNHPVGPTPLNLIKFPSDDEPIKGRQHREPVANKNENAHIPSPQSSSVPDITPVVKVAPEEPQRSPDSVQIKPLSTVDQPVRVAPLPISAKEDARQPAAFGPSTERMQYRVRYPDYEESLRNVMDPIPVPNNPQLYPFMMTIPMEGGDLLRVKEIELTVSQNYIDGKMDGKSSQYQVNMDQWYLEQDFVFAMGLPSNTQAGITIPLYHFKGNNVFTQNGVEMMGMGSGSRNFWGGPILNVKHQFYESKPQQFKALCSAYFQFPEGNQRARGGTTSGHWAINAILEKSFERERLHFNFGLTQPGDLKLLNNTVLSQDNGWFIGAGLSHKLSPTLAVEGQLHVDQSALQYTDIDDLGSPNVTSSLGLRKQWRKSLDASAAVFKGFDDLVLAGFSLDLRYHW